MKTIYINLTSKIQDLKAKSKYNRKRIYHRAKYIYNNSECTLSDAWKQSWDEAKKSMFKIREQLQLTIKSLVRAFTPQLPPQWGQDQLIKEQFMAYNSGAKMN